MTSKSAEIPFFSFLYATFVGNLVFAFPAIGGILLFNLVDIMAVLLILAVITLSVPVGAAMTWLIAKGSNWANTTAAITASCTVPGHFYGMLFGGLLGFHFFGTAGGVILAVLFFLLASAIAIPFGKFLSRKIIREPLR